MKYLLHYVFMYPEFKHEHFSKVKTFSPNDAPESERWIKDLELEGFDYAKPEVVSVHLVGFNQLG